MEKILKINKFLMNLSTVKFIIVMTFATYFFSTLITPLLAYTVNEEIWLEASQSQVLFHSLSLIGKIVLVITIIPIVETFIFQWGMIKILRLVEIFKEKNVVIISISAFVFALSHNYSIIHIVHTFIMGWIFAYAYMIYENKINKSFFQSPILVVTAIHSLRNTISLFIASI